MEYEVRIPLFEGPFDLLLFFIEKDELDIHEVSLAAITGDFLKYIQSLSALNLESASEFIWVAATLMKIKARQLIPRPKKEIEVDELDAERNLILRLIEYKKFKNIVPVFQNLEEEANLSFPRGGLGQDLDQLANWSSEKNPPEELQNLTLFRILKTYKNVLERKLSKVAPKTYQIQNQPYSLEDQKKQILSLISLNNQIDFHKVAGISKTRLELVYSFLAILELIQEQIVQIQVGLGINNFRIRKNQDPI